MLFAGLPAAQTVWMSHGDSVAAAPEGFTVTASTAADPGRRLRGPRARSVRRAVPPRGAALRARPGGAQALPRRGGLPPLLDHAQHRRGRGRGDPRGRSAEGRAICGLSGGVDSAVAAAMVQRAIGDRLTCVFVDHGLLRKGEAEQVERDFVARHRASSSGSSTPQERFLKALDGRQRPRGEAQDHRPRVHPGLRGRAARHHGRRPGRLPGPGHALPRRGRVRRRHRHRQHQVAPQRRRPARRPPVHAGGAAARRCSRTRCAGPARSSACPPAMVWRQPFPGPGLGIRIVGEVTRERLDMLREADAIAREELSARRSRPGDLAVPGRAARRRPLGGRAGRRPHLRSPDRAAPGHRPRTR